MSKKKLKKALPSHCPKSNPAPRLIFEQLQPRLLLSADGISAIAANAWAPNAAEELILPSNETVQHQQTTVHQQQQQQLRRELIAVDTGDHYSTLQLNSLLKHPDRVHTIEQAIVVIDTRYDGLSQLTAALTNSQPLDTLHIISPGPQHELHLGNTLVNVDNLLSAEQALRSWTQGLQQDANIIIYGFNQTASSQGEIIANTLSALTGASVSGSGSGNYTADTGDTATTVINTVLIEQNERAISTGIGSPSVAAQHATVTPNTAIKAVGLGLLNHNLGSSSDAVDGRGFSRGISLGQAADKLIQNKQLLGTQNGHSQLVFIDSNVENYQQLVDDITYNSGASIEIIILNKQLNGLQQIGETLAGRSGIDAIHIISHGNDGVLQLGNTRVDQAYLAEQEQLLGAWSDALSEDADLLIYGCNLAATSDGQNFISALALFTGADVAASDDLSGSAALGGNWELEVHHGSIETELAISKQAQSNWVGTLNNAPVVDLNSALVFANQVLDGPFAAHAADWEASGDGFFASDYFGWTGPNPGLLQYSPVLTNLNNGDSAAGSADIELSIKWLNSSPDTVEWPDVSVDGGASRTFSVLINTDVTYATMVTPNSGGSSTITYSNGATGNISNTTENQYTTWIIGLPADVVSSGKLTFTASGGADDDFFVNLVLVRAYIDAIAGSNYTTNFTEDSAPVSIASVNSDVRDDDNTSMTSATVTLNSPQTGDSLLVAGSSAASGTLGSGINWTRTASLVTFSGTFTNADYSAAIKSVQFETVGDNPSTTPRAISVVVNDGTTTSATATSTINVIAVDDAGTFAGATSQTVLEDSVGNTGTVTFTDPDDFSTPNFSINSVASNGTGAIDAAGSWSYTPTANYNGSDNFTVQVTDDDGNIETQVISMTVSQVNDAGNFTGDTTATTNEDTATTGTVTFADAIDGFTTANFSINSVASNGTAAIDAAGNWTYAPAANYNGSDAFTVQVTDDDGNVETQVISINVTQVNNAGSFAGNTSATTNEDTTTAGTVTFTDTVDGFSTANFSINSVAGNGTAAIDAAGNWTYTPAANYNGSDSFTVQVTDDDGNVETQVISITVTQVNDAGNFTGNTTATTNEDTATAGTVTFADALDGFTTANFSINSVASNGAAAIDAAGNWTYTPTTNYNGSDSFTVQVTDDDGNVETQVISITVNQISDAGSFAGTTSATTNEDTATAGTVTFVDTIDGFSTANFSINSAASNGSAAIDAAGNWTYTPTANYNGSDAFTVQVTDDDGNIETRVISITVTQVNDAGSFTGNTSATTNEDTATTGTVTFTDTLDGFTTTNFSINSVASNGTAAIDAAGNWTYTPTANYNGSDSFTVQVSDDDGNVETQMIAITVTQT
ncbi:MAG: VCBS repeat-containing protein, partial [Paraglaciecola psychrophila]